MGELRPHQRQCVVQLLGKLQLGVDAARLDTWLAAMTGDQSPAHARTRTIIEHGQDEVLDDLCGDFRRDLVNIEVAGAAVILLLLLLLLVMGK